MNVEKEIHNKSEIAQSCLRTCVGRDGGKTTIAIKRGQNSYQKVELVEHQVRFLHIKEGHNGDGSVQPSMGGGRDD